MCGRFTLAKPQVVQKRFNTQNKMPLFEASYNIAPGQTLPVITKNSPNKIIMMKWGYVWSKDASYGTINIRKETTKEKKYLRRILTAQRCIIPSDGFYEWRTVNLEGKDEKYPFYICRKDQKHFGFAGLYNKLTDAEGKPIYTFAILTCPPNKRIKKIHDRMPTILRKKDEEAWLDPENKDFDNLYRMLKPYPSSKMKMYPVSRRVNSPRNDDEDLIKPFEEQKLF